MTGTVGACGAGMVAGSVLGGAGCVAAETGALTTSPQLGHLHDAASPRSTTCLQVGQVIVMRNGVTEATDRCKVASDTGTPEQKRLGGSTSAVGEIRFRLCSRLKKEYRTDLASAVGYLPHLSGNCGTILTCFRLAGGYVPDTWYSGVGSNRSSFWYDSDAGRLNGCSRCQGGAPAILDGQVPCNGWCRQRVRLETEQPTCSVQVPWITWPSMTAGRSPWRFWRAAVFQPARIDGGILGVHGDRCTAQAEACGSTAGS